MTALVKLVADPESVPPPKREINFDNEPFEIELRECEPQLPGIEVNTRPLAQILAAICEFAKDLGALDDRSFVRMTYRPSDVGYLRFEYTDSRTPEHPDGSESACRYDLPVVSEEYREFAAQLPLLRATNAAQLLRVRHASVVIGLNHGMVNLGPLQVPYYGFAGLDSIIPELGDDDVQIATTREEVAKICHRVVRAQARKLDKKYEYHGVLIDFEKRSANGQLQWQPVAIAANGARMHMQILRHALVRSMHLNPEPTITWDHFWSMVWRLSQDGEPLRVGFNKQRAVGVGKDGHFVVVMPSESVGDRPVRKWRQVPRPKERMWVVKRKLLLDTAEKAIRMTTNARWVEMRMAFKDNLLYVKSVTEDGGVHRAKIGARAVVGPPETRGFTLDARYVHDALETCGEELVHISFSGSSATDAVTFADESRQFMSIVMPRRQQ